MSAVGLVSTAPDAAIHVLGRKLDNIPFSR